MEDNVKITFSECEVGEPELLQRDVMTGMGGGAGKQNSFKIQK